MRGIGNGRKVRCHKEAVENPLARLAIGYDCAWKLKMVADPSVPAFSSFDYVVKGGCPRLLTSQALPTQWVPRGRFSFAATVISQDSSLFFVVPLPNCTGRKDYRTSNPIQ